MLTAWFQHDLSNTIQSLFLQELKTPDAQFSTNDKHLSSHHQLFICFRLNFFYLHQNAKLWGAFFSFSETIQAFSECLKISRQFQPWIQGRRGNLSYDIWPGSNVFGAHKSHRFMTNGIKNAKHFPPKHYGTVHNQCLKQFSAIKWANVPICLYVPLFMHHPV